MCKQLFLCNVIGSLYSQSTPLLRVSRLFHKGEEEKGKKPQIKRKTMAQWMNLLQNSRFVNKMRLPSLCEKSGAIALMLLGLMAGRLAVRQAGRRNSAKFKNF